MSNLVKRTLSGIVYIAVLISCIVLHAYATEVLFLAFTVLAVRELHKLLGSDRVLTAESIAIACGIYMQQVSAFPIFWDIATWAMVIVALAAELFRKAENPIKNWAYLTLSMVMIAVPFSLVNVILTFGEWEQSRWILMAIFACVWSNDTGAYCVGSLIGKHKMFPRVSPGKTWEGLVGGVIFSLLCGYVFSLFLPAPPMWKWLLIAFTVSVFGTFGDLMESLLKRTLGVKDSGNFMPGHGGVLDRFDSVLLCLPAVYLLLEFLSAY